MDTQQPSAQQVVGPVSQADKPRRKWKLGQRAAQAALVILLCAGGFLSLFPLGRAFTRSALLLPSLLSASEPAPLAAAGDPVRFTRLTLFQNTPQPVYLDIYEPATPPPPIPGGREVILDVPGAGDNRSVGQLINLSQSLAREGIIDVNVGTPAMFDYRVTTQESDAVVQAFEFMEHRPGVNPQHIGIITFSVASLSAYMAAADPRIRDKVAFLALLGGYADVTSLLRASGSRSQDVNGQIQPWQPIATVPYVLYRSVSDLFSPSDQQLFQEAFPLTANFPPPLPAAQVAQFSPVAAAYYHLLEGDQPGNVDRNLALLTPQLQTLLTQLSPLTYISRVRTTIHLLHDRNDPAIPYAQGLEMAATLTRLHHPYDLAAYSIFSHVQVNLSASLNQLIGDGSKLLSVLTSILLVGS